MSLQTETLFQHSGLWALGLLAVLEAPRSLSPQTHRKKTPETDKTHAATLPLFLLDTVIISKSFNILHFWCRTARRLSLGCLCEIWTISSSSCAAPLWTPCGNLFPHSNQTPLTGEAWTSKVGFHHYLTISSHHNNTPLETVSLFNAYFTAGCFAILTARL